MVLGYNEFEGFDRRKNNIMGPIEHFYTGEETNYDNNRRELDDLFNTYNTTKNNDNLEHFKAKATEIIDHIKLIRNETDRISGDTQTAFNKIDGIITDVDTTEKNEDILNKRTTFDKKYNNIKELNNKNKKIVTILLVVNIVIMTILLFGSYLVLSDKGNPFGKSKVSNNKNGYNNLSSL